MYEGVVSIVWSMDCRGQERTRSMESMEACCHFCRSRRREEMRAVPVVTIPLSRTSINQPLLSSTTHIPSKVNLFLIENVMMLLVLVVFRLLWMLCWIFILMNLVLYIMMCFSLWLQVLQKLLRDNYYSNYTSCNSFCWTENFTPKSLYMVEIVMFSWMLGWVPNCSTKLF